MPAPVSYAASQAILRSQHPLPFQLQGEYAVDEVISNAQTPRELVMQIRPQVPQQWMPPRYGYERIPLTIQDVLATDRWAPTFRSWVSGPRIIPPPPIDPNGMGGVEPTFGKNSVVGASFGPNSTFGAV
jgi:hypothetical protein